MRTNAKATNWPTRDKARDTIPRESRKGSNVASPRKKEARFKRNVLAQMETLLARAEKFATRAAATPLSEARALELDRSTRAIGAAAEQRRIATHPTRAPLADATKFVGDGMRYFAPLNAARSK